MTFAARIGRGDFNLILALAQLVALTSPHLPEGAASEKACFKTNPKQKDQPPTPLLHRGCDSQCMRITFQRSLPGTALKHSHHLNYQTGV